MLTFCISLFSFAKSQSSYQYECLSVGEDGYVTIKIWNSQKGKNYKLEQAQKDAVYVIVFSGIAPTNGCITQKPILQQTEEQAKFKNIEKNFFKANGDYLTYVRSSETSTTIPVNLGEKDWKVFQISVAKNLLRKYFQDKKIVKPLNTGF